MKRQQLKCMKNYITNNMKKSELRKIIKEELLKEGSRALYNKMEKELDPKDLKNFQSSTTNIIKKLLSDGFDKKDVEDYIFDNIDDNLYSY